MSLFLQLSSGNYLFDTLPNATFTLQTNTIQYTQSISSKSKNSIQIISSYSQINWLQLCLELLKVIHTLWQKGCLMYMDYVWSEIHFILRGKDKSLALYSKVSHKLQFAGMEYDQVL